MSLASIPIGHTDNEHVSLVIPTIDRMFDSGASAYIVEDNRVAEYQGRQVFRCRLTDHQLHFGREHRSVL